MRANRSNLPEVTQLLSGKTSIRTSTGRLSGPRLLRWAVNSYSWELFSFTSLSIKCDRYSLKTDNPWERWDASQPFFFTFCWMCIDEILELRLYLGHQDLRPSQRPPSSSCFVSIGRFPGPSVPQACDKCAGDSVREGGRGQWTQAFKRAQVVESGRLSSAPAPLLSDS